MRVNILFLTVYKGEVNTSSQISKTREWTDPWQTMKRKHKILTYIRGTIVHILSVN